jgi:hypothetical protein
MGNDLVRFIDLVIGRPTFVSGLSSGGVLSAWPSAYAKPGQVVGAHYEDPPLWHSETEPAGGQGLRQGVGASFRPQNLKEWDPEWARAFWTGTVQPQRRPFPSGCG